MSTGTPNVEKYDVEVRITNGKKNDTKLAFVIKEFRPAERWS